MFTLKIDPDYVFFVFLRGKVSENFSPIQKYNTVYSDF